jgi:hypothetical protein
MIKIKSSNNLKATFSRIVSKFDSVVSESSKAGGREYRRHGMGLADIEELPEPDQILLKAMGAVDETGFQDEKKIADKKVLNAVMKGLNKLFGK